MNNGNKLTLDVSGQTFRLDRDDILRYPNSLLYSYLSHQNLDDTSLSFERPVSSFLAIHALYQTGELHMPPTVCPKAFSLELDFWGLNLDQMENCCYFKLLEALDDDNVTRDFREEMLKSDISNKTTGVSFKERLWSVLDNSESTIWSKTYLMIAVLFVIISVLSLSLSTLPSFRRSLTTCELRDFIREAYEDDLTYEYFDFFMQKYDCQDHPTDIWNIDDYDLDENDTDVYDMWNVVQKETKTTLSDKTTKLEVFHYLDYAVITFFTLELILRLATCPSLIQYFFNFFNILDVLILFTSYAEILITFIRRKHKYNPKGINILLYLQILRSFRILRLVQNVSAVKVLKHCFYRSYQDILVLILLLFIGINIFASAFYFVEDVRFVESIPQAWWWALVSMTTVGYGDIFPKTLGGKIVGSLCVLCGVLLLSLVIPVFVSSFVTLYQCVQLNQKRPHLHRKTKKKQSYVSSATSIKISPESKTKDSQETQTDREVKKEG